MTSIIIREAEGDLTTDREDHWWKQSPEDEDGGRAMSKGMQEIQL